MQLFPRLIRRKRNLRRILAGAFVLIALVEAGSHAYMDYHRAADASTPNGCAATDNRPTTADCPDKRKQRSQERNVIDEMTIHAVILDRMSVPTSGRLYNTADGFSLHAKPLSGVPDPPFHPPEQA